MSPMDNARIAEPNLPGFLAGLRDWLESKKPPNHETPRLLINVDAEFVETLVHEIEELDWQPVGNHPSNEEVLTCIFEAGDLYPVCVTLNTFTDHSNTAPGYRIGRDKSWWNSPPHKPPTHWRKLGCPR